MTARTGSPLDLTGRCPSGRQVGTGQADAEAIGISRRSSLVLGALPSAVACARLHARQILWEWDVRAEVDTAELLVSELITNGLKASWVTGRNPPVRLYLAASQSLLLIEVWDGTSSRPRLRTLTMASRTWTRKAAGACSSSALSARTGAGTRPATPKER